MGKTSQGTFRIPGGFELQNNTPPFDNMEVEFDADLLVDTNADGTLKTTELREGMIVYSKESKTHYKWNGLDRTVASNWVQQDNSKWEIVQENPYNLKVPTGAEWQAEIDTWTSDPDIRVSAFNSPLKITSAGGRNFPNGAILGNVTNGRYWSSTALSGQFISEIMIVESDEAEVRAQTRANGQSVRLIVNGDFTQQQFDDDYQNQIIFIDSLSYGFVYSPTTNKIWLDRNLGASQIATSFDDINSFGDLYQWGRPTDGHEKRTSSVITTLSNTDQPNHGDFIANPSSDTGYDWRFPQNNDLWQGTVGINNPAIIGEKLIGKESKQASYNDLKDLPDKASENATATGTVNLDLSTFESQKLNLTGNTTLTVSNLPAVGKSKVINLAITTANNTETLTLPGTWNVYGEFDPAVRNKLSIEFANFATSGLEVDCFINQPT